MKNYILREIDEYGDAAAFDLFTPINKYATFTPSGRKRDARVWAALRELLAEGVIVSDGRIVERWRRAPSPAPLAKNSRRRTSRRR
jgi:hypothetical protein